jgi:hypothetical protein
MAVRRLSRRGNVIRRAKSRGARVRVPLSFCPQHQPKPFQPNSRISAAQLKMASAEDYGFLRPPRYVAFIASATILPSVDYPCLRELRALTIGLYPHSNDDYEPVYRKPSSYNPLQTFTLPMGSVRHYQQQYGDMYFLRLAKLKPAVEKVATDAWGELTVRISLWKRQC